jgi:addiction module HigA family antidote
MTTRLRAPLHPGEVLLEEVVKPLDMSVNQLALALGIGATRLNEVVRGRRGITADTAFSLGKRPPEDLPPQSSATERCASSPNRGSA